MEHHFVVAGTDGSWQSLCAVEWAAHEAAMRGATLRVVSVPTLPPPMSWHRSPRGTPETVAEVIIQTSEEALAKAADHAAQAEYGLAVETALRSGAPALALAKAAADACLLVVGSRGSHSCGALAPGFVSRYVATRARCPVVVVREETTALRREVVIGVRDLDQPTAISFAFEEASLRRARLRVMRAWRWLLPSTRSAVTGLGGATAEDVTTEVTQWLAESVTFWRQKYPEVDVVEEVVHASAAQALAGRSANADLIILGRNVSDDIRHPESNPVIHAVLNHAQCPVVIVPE
jgi:nucleotide-binding universal stress UspA family protein